MSSPAPTSPVHPSPGHRELHAWDRERVRQRTNSDDIRLAHLPCGIDIHQNNVEAIWERLGGDFRGVLPVVSADGKYPFFSRDLRSYWVDAGAVEQRRPRGGAVEGRFVVMSTGDRGHDLLERLVGDSPEASNRIR